MIRANFTKYNYLLPGQQESGESRFRRNVRRQEVGAMLEDKK